jgi:LmbE family N-acetylglucosaminyl deacetylase
MYGQIAQTLFSRSSWSLLAPRLPLAVRLALLVLVIGLGSSLAYNRSQASVHSRVSDLPLLSLEGLQRVLVVAPHPDDEALGAGGLIQAALAQGSQVRVIVVTNGDGQGLGPLALHGRLRARAADYVSNGLIRQDETVVALGRLGLPPEDIIFMGYPDGALGQLWLSSWSTACPVQASFTRAYASPYSVTFNPGARYCGDDLLRDMESVIGAFNPDLVLLPHPQDDHSDHRATTAFARMALGRAALHNEAFRPQVWAYLVHYGDFPQPRGRRLSSQLSPPLPLLRDDVAWTRFDLNPAQVNIKASSLAAYSTQQRLLGAFLYSFARQNELFARLPVFVQPEFAIGEAPLVGAVAWHTVREPAKESTRRLLLQGADLVELRVARVGDTVWVSAVTRGPLFERLQYEIFIKTDDGRTEVMRYPGQADRTAINIATGRWSLEGLGSPEILAVSARVRQGGTLEQTAWHMISLSDLAILDEAP